MADPLFDENHILSLLSVPINRDNIDAVQAGAVQALMDLYDRKVTREEFVACLAPCLVLYGQAAKLWILHNVKDVHDAGYLETEKFDEASEGLCDSMRKHCETVIEIVKRQYD
jgi:hypothetical protein